MLRVMSGGGEAMVRRVYGHLGQVRHQAAVVEYRVQQHVDKLGGRLVALALERLVPRAWTATLIASSDDVATPRA